MRFSIHIILLKLILFEIGGAFKSENAFEREHCVCPESLASR
jgi:hypothetical protein